jgi:PAS domain S-box-containing protein
MTDTAGSSRRWALVGDSAADRELRELAAMDTSFQADLDRYRALFAAAPAALLVTDTNLRVLEANQAAADLLAVELRFLLGKPLATYVAADVRRDFRTWPARLARGATTQSAPFRMLRRTGVPFDAQLTVLIGRGELYWTIVDRTEEVQAEARLWELNHELEERVAAQSAGLEALVEQLPLGVAIFDGTGNVAWMNGRAVEIVGGQLLEGSSVVREARRALAGEVIRGVRLTLTLHDGRLRTIALTAAPVTRHGGAAVVLADVTDRDRIDRADAEFVENAAHQLRNPIAAITSSVAALDAGAKDEPSEREKFIAHVARESARLEQVVEALLTLAGLQHADASPLLELVPLEPLLADAAASISPNAARVVVACDKGVGVVADRDLLAQAVGNVVANAADHTGSEKVRIEARVDGEAVTIDVVDGGHGVPPELRERVFDRFFRGPSDGRNGSGLGLAIALAAARATGAQLELLDQREGEGARFRFTIPGARLL